MGFDLWTRKLGCDNYCKGLSGLSPLAAALEEEERPSTASHTYPVERLGLGQRVAKSKHQHFSTELLWSEPVGANVGRLQEEQGVRMRVRITICKT